MAGAPTRRPFGHEHSLARHASLAEQLVRLSCFGKRKSLRDGSFAPQQTANASGLSTQLG